MRMFENRLLRKVFDLKGESVSGGKKRQYNENFVICVSHEMSFG